ncbi:MAG: phage tail sheath family protein [Candidatus Helarchaeota archaeon]
MAKHKIPDIPTIEEGRGSHKIVGVPTSIAGFIGLAKAGPVNEPVPIRSFDEFEEKFGGYWEQGQLAYSVKGFFQNGGRQCFIVRVNETEDVVSITDEHYIGDIETKTGLYAFQEVHTVKLIAIPDAAGAPVVMSAGITYCENCSDCFFIADIPLDKSPSDVVAHMETAELQSSYGAIYYPNIYVEDPLSDEKRLVHPSGHIAGCYAKSDNQRGVWKAPAGKDRQLIGVDTLEVDITQSDQEQLKPIGVNVIRKFADVGIVVWGAHTLDQGGEYRYVNVRRFVNYVKESVEKSTQWTIFEPNGDALWAKLRGTIQSFLEKLFRSGALQGSKPKDAFFVKCDHENNLPITIEEGKVIIEIGLAIVKPTEFTRMTITQRAGDKPSS